MKSRYLSGKGYTHTDRDTGGSRSILIETLIPTKLLSNSPNFRSSGQISIAEMGVCKGLPIVQEFVLHICE